MRNELKQIAKQALALMPDAKWIAQDEGNRSAEGYWYAFQNRPILERNNIGRCVWVPGDDSNCITVCKGKAPAEASKQLYEISEVLKQARQKTISNIANSMFLLCWLPIIIAGLLHEYLPHGSAKFLYIASALFLITGAVLSVTSKNNEPKNNTNEQA